MAVEEPLPPEAQDWKIHWPPLSWDEAPVRVPEIKPRDLLRLRYLAIAGGLSMALFTIWLLAPERRGAPWLYWPLVTTLLFQCVGWIYEWLNYSRSEVMPHQPAKSGWKVDVLTTACPGEPLGMIVRTLAAMKNIRYPHENYLCDEGDDPVLKAICKKWGIHHITRSEKRDAKAGNINNALRQSGGNIAVVLDPDHEPSPFLLDRTLGYFDDPDVGYVQSVQAYRNQNESLVARGAAQETYLFYGPMMLGMHRNGTTQAIGANCVFRREALDSIGGHAAGLSEDMHTSMRLFSKGWKAIYTPEILTRGLVPATMSGYFKQQLKWSCGSFELLLQEYPKLFRGFNFWQRIHYCLGPLYFIRGLVALIMILVPILSLLTGTPVLNMTLPEFIGVAAPLLIIVFLVRQAVQNWVLEPAERGVHLVGGLLNTATWWVFLAGTVCALARIKIPYIPTPKDSRAGEDWRLAVPNAFAAAASIFAIIYGLNRDFTPYSLLMASFAFCNALQLFGGLALGYQFALRQFSKTSRFLNFCKLLVGTAVRLERSIHDPILNFFRRSAVVLTVIALTGLIAWKFKMNFENTRPLNDGRPELRDTGGFYLGWYDPEADRGHFPTSFQAASKALGSNFQIASMYQAWGPESIHNFPTEALRKLRREGSVPMITWEPWSGGFLKNDPELFQNRRVLKGILRGAFDEYLNAYAQKAREFGEPMLLRFAHECDNPAYPWSQSGGNTPEEYVKAWVHVVDIFRKNGASNVGWVWNPWRPEAVEKYYPGDDYVDWIGLTALNYGKASSDGKWRSFRNLYEPFHARLKNIKRPILLAEFGSTAYGGDQKKWISEALEAVQSSYPQIRGTVFFYSNQDKNWVTKWRPAGGASTIDWTFPLEKTGFGNALQPLIAAAPKVENKPLWTQQLRAKTQSSSIVMKGNQFQLLADGKPFYLRAVAYNPGHDWRDGNIPVTRHQVDADFAAIRSMGANSIRRYGSGWYDYNILKSARAHDLKVLYGFWFDQHLDYLHDTGKLEKYQRDVESFVTAHRDDPTILAWGLGNEVWGLLKHYYAQPYLTQQRWAHIDFVEKLAKRIHEIDPKRPVWVANEHSDHLAGALADFAIGAPSLDFTGVNSYYTPLLSQLEKTAQRFDPKRPYLISEFGPDGYWEKEEAANTPLGLLAEIPASKKAVLYGERWTRYVEAAAGSNLGGVAYCWRDRMEATSTWFGLTDFHSKPKAAYYVMRQKWTGQTIPTLPVISSINFPNTILHPEAPFQATAHLGPAGEPNPKLEWKIESADFAPDKGNVLATTGTTANFKAPTKPGDYRVYLHASGTHGVDEANFPIRVTAKP